MAPKLKRMAAATLSDVIQAKAGFMDAIKEMRQAAFRIYSTDR